MRAWPLVFAYRGVVDGAEFSALVDIKSRVLAEEQESGRIWMDGAQPGGFAIGGQDMKSAYEALKGMFRGILEDMAKESDSFEAFHAETQRFFDDVDTGVSAEWTKHWRASRKDELDCEPVNWMGRMRGAATRPSIEVLAIEHPASGAGALVLGSRDTPDHYLQAIAA